MTRPYSDSFEFVIPVQSSSSSVHLAGVSSPAGQPQAHQGGHLAPLSPQGPPHPSHFLQNPSSSSTRNAYRHSGLVESGEFHQGAGTSYSQSRSVSLANPHTDMDVDPQPAPPTISLPFMGSGALTHQQPNNMYGGQGRKLPSSFSQLSPHPPPQSQAGRSHSMSGLGGFNPGDPASPPSNSSASVTRRRTSSSHRMAHSPNPPLQAQPSIQQQQQQTTDWNTTFSPQGQPMAAQSQQQQMYARISPGPPPQSGLMRRGMSYDGAFGVPVAPASVSPHLPPPGSSNASLLPTVYRPSGGQSSASTSMVGITPTTNYASTSNPMPPPGSPSANALFFPPNPSASSSAAGLPPMSAPPVPQQSQTMQPPPPPPRAVTEQQQQADHSRHPSYSPSHYAAGPSHVGGPYQAPPPPSAFYAHHIPATSSSHSAPSMAQAVAPPVSSSYASSSVPLSSSNHQAQQFYPTHLYPSDSNNPNASSPALGSSSSALTQQQSPTREPTQPIASTSAPASAYYAGGDARPSTSSSYSAGFSSPEMEMERRGGGEKKGFKKVRDVREIKRVVNQQPKGRRADPAGGFISPLKALTTNLPQTYHVINPAFRYETSLNPRRVLTKPSKPATNDGFDNEDSDYILYVNDVLGAEDKDRYLILDVLGQGTFGQVVKCQNMKTHEIVAVKVVKNKPAYFQQSMMEVTILELINNQWDKDDTHHMLRLKDTFIHHSHLCLVFELLSNNLYELIKQNSFRGLSTSLVRVFTAQLLDALTVLQEAKIIHCDLKPENILLKSLQSPTIKVIDFGSACHEKQTVYTYIQSRFYRSPEVILSVPYSTAIDMWSLGCICVELFLGLPLFPGTSEYNQISRIVEMLGMPPDHMLERGKQAANFFEPASMPDYDGRRRWRLKSLEKYSAEHKTPEQPSKKYFSATTLPDIIKQYPLNKKGDVEKENNNRIAFIDFVQGCLQIDPDLRWTPQQARLHPFVTNETLKAPFVPPPHLKPINGPSFSSKALPPTSPTATDGKRYGGLPPAPQRSGTRTYQDAKAYNTHLNQQQSYQSQQAAQQAAQRAAQGPTNPFQPPGHIQQQQMQMQAQAQAQAQAVHNAQQLQQQQMQMQQVAQQQAAANAAASSSFYATSSSRPTQIPPPHQLGASVANPPAVHHYTTRGRSNTLTQDLPPALQKLGHDLGVHGGTGQSITPVLRRDDQWQAWERIQNGGGDGAGGPNRRISISRHPHLNLLQEQAENGLNSWNSPLRQKPASTFYQYQSPTQPSQPQFSVVVDGRDQPPPLGLFDANIAAPPQAYNGGAPRYPTYNAGGPPPQSQYESSPFDSYSAGESLAPMYQPLNPSNRPPQQQQPPQQLQPGISFYGPSVPANNSFPISPNVALGGSKGQHQGGKDQWGR